MPRSRLTAGRSRWAVLAITLISFVGVLVVTSGAQAVVVNDSGTNPGAALVPRIVGGQEAGAGKGSTAGPLQVRLQLMPQGLKQLLRSGIEVRVTANEGANGFASVSIPRALAKQLHLKAGRASETVIGEGTVSQVKDGTVTLHLSLSKQMVAKLKRLNMVTFKVSLQLMGAAGDHLTADAAGSY